MASGNNKHHFSSMQLALFVAKRYLFSRKEKTIVNIISWISLIGIAVSTMALVVVMSVYNGIGELTQSLFNVFDPALIVEPVQGKTFRTGEIPYDAMRATPGVAQISPIVEENAWVTHRQNESIVQLRGVDESYAATCGIDTLILEGEYSLRDGDEYYLLLGWNILYNLEVNSMSNTPVAIHIPKRGTTAIGLTMDEAFNNGYAYVAGAFRIQEEIDGLYVLTHIDFVRSLMGYAPDEVTSLAVSVENPRQLGRVKQQLARQLGEGYTVKDRYEQKPLYYKIFHSERLGVFLILSLIVLISTLNLIASLSLLIINKRKDIATMRSMGMEQKQIRRVFFTEGILIAAVGTVIGLVGGFVVCLLQQQFGIVKLGANAVVDAFPVAMRVVDFAATFGIVTLLSCMVVWFTVRRAFK
ncbi:MAG: FtsX-like permease family protein [Bacteroidales bacterium]|nr:FtsX-like permease family protein [Bacteroidales bacterium]